MGSQRIGRDLATEQKPQIKCLKSLKTIIIIQNVFYDEGVMGLSWLKPPASGKFRNGGKFFPHSDFQANSLCKLPSGH